jgi:excisionase family DNA binding protein
MAAKAHQPEFKPAVMTVREVADYLQIHPTTLYRILNRGEIPAFRVGSDWRFSREAIDRWSMGQTAGGRAVAAKSKQSR